jgi:hypothetical protein
VVGLPRKWTHLEFLLELIDDFFGCPQTSIDGSVVTTSSSGRTRQGSTYSAAASANQNDTFYDLSTEDGRLDYFNLVKPTRMTKKGLNVNAFASRFDGKFHPELPNPSPEAYCQYCRYKFNNVWNDDQKRKNKKLFQNRASIVRCLTCNVNLCWMCKNDWHGVGYGTMNTLVSRS